MLEEMGVNVQGQSSFMRVISKMQHFGANQSNPLNDRDSAGVPEQLEVSYNLILVVLCVHTWSLCRFVLANLAGQCRRKTILEHFEESTANVLTTGVYCDVCQHDGIESSNACVHTEIVLNAVKDYGGHREKVHRCTHIYTHLHTCTVYMLCVCV